MMNTVILIGRLTKDPETRTSGETTVTRFSLAVDRGDKNGNTDFPNVVCFGKVAEAVAKYMSKGRLVAVHGQLRTGSYTDKKGNKRYTTEVAADVVKFLDSKKD